MEDFEFSQNYFMFWDKIEKANYFLEMMIKMRDKDLDDRKVHHMIKTPLPDGGEWHMFVNVIKKYGLVPKSVMQDTFSRENSRFINELVGYKLREIASLLRKMHKEGKSEDQIRAKKEKLFEEVYRILTILFGIPPEKFDWSFRDKDKKYHQEIGITPLEFLNKYVGFNFDELYTLGSCPTEPFYKTYTIDLFHNMIGGDGWKFLNLPAKDLKNIAVKMLKNEEAVLYGCDVLQESHTKEGILYDNLFDYDLIFKTKFGMDKATRLRYCQSVLTHSMVLIGVDLVDGKPTKWKVENSWGVEAGKKGYFIMSDKWFEEHALDMIVPKKYMTKKMLELIQLDPVTLPHWHCMV